MAISILKAAEDEKVSLSQRIEAFKVVAAYEASRTKGKKNPDEDAPVTSFNQIRAKVNGHHTEGTA